MGQMTQPLKELTGNTVYKFCTEYEIVTAHSKRLTLN